jgi:hypothetical protein
MGAIAHEDTGKMPVLLYHADIIEVEATAAAIDNDPVGKENLQVADHGAGAIGPAIEPSLVDAAILLTRSRLDRICLVVVS